MGKKNRRVIDNNRKKSYQDRHLEFYGIHTHSSLLLKKFHTSYIYCRSGLDIA